MAHYHQPLDPDCPEVERFTARLFGDPMTHAMGAPTDEIMAGFKRKHIATCQRCRDYGAANIAVRA